MFGIDLYDGGVGGVSGGCVAVVVLMEKNPTASSIIATPMIMIPTRTIVRIAPIRRSSPAVLNRLTPDFKARMLNDFL